MEASERDSVFHRDFGAGAKVPMSVAFGQNLSTYWSEPGSPFTQHFEAFAVQLSGACRSPKQVTELLKLDWDGVQRLVERAVTRGFGLQKTLV